MSNEYHINSLTASVVSSGIGLLKVASIAGEALTDGNSLAQYAFGALEVVHDELGDVQVTAMYVEVLHNDFSVPVNARRRTPINQ